MREVSIEGLGRKATLRRHKKNMSAAGRKERIYELLARVGMEKDAEKLRS